jgi:hypothetical protein
VGIYLGRSKLGVTKWSPGEISEASIGASPLRARHQISVRQKGRVVRAGQQPIRL